MKRKISIQIIILFLFLPSCIEPLYFNNGEASKNLVVDGLITNEPGPYVVYLARTSEYNSYYVNTEEVGGAIVIISDDMGNSEVLTESYIPGIYKTDPDGIRGIPGRFYKIEIETPDGKQYESEPELLCDVPGIETVYYERQQFQEIDDNGIVEAVDGFQIYLNTIDPENDKNYYMWSWGGTHEVHSQPWDYRIGRMAAPKDCCATCWLTDRPGYIDVLDDTFLDGNQLNKKPVTFVRIINSDGARLFRGKYHVEVKQLSLSREAYKYWSSIEEQISSAGSIFEPPPVSINGNIKNVNNTEDLVFGYFGASAISTNSVIIPASETPYLPGDTLVFPDDCRRMSNSTAIMPSFW